MRSNGTHESVGGAVHWDSRACSREAKQHSLSFWSSSEDGVNITLLHSTRYVWAAREGQEDMAIGGQSSEALISFMVRGGRLHEVQCHRPSPSNHRREHSPFSYVFDETGCPCVPGWALTHYVCSWAWSWTSDPPTPTSQVLWLQARMNTPVSCSDGGGQNHCAWQTSTLPITVSQPHFLADKCNFCIRNLLLKFTFFIL